MIVSHSTKVAGLVFVEPAFHGRREWLSSTQLAEMIAGDLSFLQHAIDRLWHAGIIRCKRGRQSGFQLSMSAEWKTLAENASVLDGASRRNKCMFDAEPCGGESGCWLSDAWHPICEQVLRLMGTETIQSVTPR
jgi:Rrf2 family protein